MAVAGARRILAGFAMAYGAMVLISTRADAGWWSRAPADFEECAASAQKNATSPEDKDKQLTACEARFAGRRKPGGGYTYFDFMQNRHFDIAGPNPTAEEQKHIDEQYAAFLKDQRRSIIAAAFLQKRQQVEQATVAASAVAKPATDPKTPSGGVKTGRGAHSRASASASENAWLRKGTFLGMQLVAHVNRRARPQKGPVRLVLRQG